MARQHRPKAIITENMVLLQVTVQMAPDQQQNKVWEGGTCLYILIIITLHF